MTEYRVKVLERRMQKRIREMGSESAWESSDKDYGKDKARAESFIIYSESRELAEVFSNIRIVS